MIIDKEKEQARIKDFLESLLKGINNVLFIYGNGVGKTLIVKNIKYSVNNK